MRSEAVTSAVQVARGRAFTLIELIAVVVILGIAGVIAIGSAGSLNQTQQRLTAIATLSEGMGRAAIAARTWGGVRVTLGPAITSTPLDDVRGVTLRTNFPKGWSAHAWSWQSVSSVRGEEMASLTLNLDGLCTDALIELTGPRGVRVSLERLGLSGQLNLIEDESSGGGAL